MTADELTKLIDAAFRGVPFCGDRKLRFQFPVMVVISKLAPLAGKARREPAQFAS